MHIEMLMNAVLLAQADGAGAGAGGAAGGTSEVQSAWDFVLKGGPMMLPIALCSLVAVAVFIERLISLRRSAVMPGGFIPGLRKRLDDEGRAHAIAYCTRSKTPVGNVFASALRRFDQPVELIEKNVTENGQREVIKLRKNLRVLSVIAAVSPLLGLLGTIFGMITAFRTVEQSADALGKTELLAGGIYEAMISTAAGLIVAIPALIGYHILAARVDRMVMEIDRAAVDFLEERLLNIDRPQPGTDARALAVGRDVPTAKSQSTHQTATSATSATSP
ncbi:MAG: MotA/TolQ/ExbB proton channel family protein [Phycisphaerales bacterium]